MSTNSVQVKKEIQEKQIQKKQEQKAFVSELIEQDYNEELAFGKGKELVAIGEQLVLRVLPQIKKATDKALIPIIGITGAGKSTLFNYLAGCKMKSITYRGKPVISAENAYVEIGHAPVSQTLNPEVCLSENGYVYCDCPGLFDTRGAGVIALNSLGIELMIESAKNIPAVVVVVSYSEIEAGRGALLIDLVKTLNKFFKDPEGIAESLLFVVTKAPNLSVDAVLGEINTLLESRKLEDRASIDDFRKKYSSAKLGAVETKELNDLRTNDQILAVLDIISKYKNLIVVDVLNNKSRQEIESWIISRKKGTLTADNFAFESYDESRVNFNDLMIKIASEGVSLLQKEKAYQEQILEKEKIKEGKGIERAPSLKDEKMLGIEKKVKALEQELNKNLMSQDDEQQLEIAQLERRIRLLENSDRVVPYWDKDLRTKLSFWQRFFPWSWIEEIVRYEDKNVPYEKVVLTQDNGSFRVEVDDPEKGMYRAVYQSDFHTSAAAKVEVHVQEKDSPQGKEMVKRLKEELSSKKSALAQRVQEVADSIEEIEKQIDKLSNELSDITGRINTAQELFNKVRTISTVLKHKHPFNTEIITTFIQLLDTRQNNAKLDPKEARFKKYQDRLEICLYEAIKIGHEFSAVLCLTTLQQMQRDGQLQGQLLLAGKDKDKEPALFTLARFNRTGWLDTFLKYFDLFTTDDQGNTVLHAVVQHGDFAFCEVLIAAGILRGTDIWPKNNKGETPFHTIASNGKVDLMIHLAAYCHAEKELFVSTFNGDTIIHLLVRAKHLAALERLLGVYPRLSLCIKNTKGHDALMEAVLTQDVDLVKCLVRANVDLASRDNEGQTALHLAVLSGQLEIVKILVERGAYLELRNKQDKMPIELVFPFDPIRIYLNNYSLQQQPQRYFNQQKLLCRNLIFQGGGVKGMAYLGALKALEEEGVCDLSNVRRVGGSSAGAITALLIGLNYSLDEIEDLMLHRLQFREFLDGPWGEELLAAKNKDLALLLGEENSTIIQRLKSMDTFWSRIARVLDGTVGKSVNLLASAKNELQHAYADVKGKFGLCPGEKLRDLFDTLIKNKLSERMHITVTEEVTFAELAQYADFKSIYFVGVNIESGEQEIFSAEHTPDMVVADALRISMSIPGVFEPWRKKTKDKNGQLHRGKTLYIDGGVLWNYPVDMFDFRRYQSDPMGNQDFQVNYETIGFRLISSTSPVQKEASKLSSANNLAELRSYIGKIISAIYYKEDSDHKRQGNAFRTIYIDTLDVGTIDFDKAEDPSVQAQMIAAGHTAVLEFKTRVEKNLQKSVRLPKVLEETMFRYLTMSSLQVEHGQPQMTGKFMLNPNCPELVVAFYAQKDDAEILRNYLHQVLQISLWARGENGNTAFHIAARDNNVEALEALLAADPSGENALNFAGETPSAFAKNSQASMFFSRSASALSSFTSSDVLVDVPDKDADELRKSPVLN